MEKTSFKEWLEKEAEKEGLKIKVCFIKDDYRAEAKKDGTIRIPEDLFAPFFTEEERRAVGAHELAHLKYRHDEKANKWLEKKVLFGVCILMLVTLPLAVSLDLLGIDKILSILSTIIIIGALIAVTIRVLRQYLRLWQMFELDADKYAAEKTSPTALISYFEKSEKVKEKWRKDSRWRATIWLREHVPTHPSKNERIKHLKKLQSII